MTSEIPPEDLAKILRGEMTPGRRAELQQQLAAMQAASDTFYSKAVRIGVHPFIEFTGLMNEWIKLCRAALDQGIDYAQISVHAGPRADLPIHAYHAEYLGEKFGCIFSQWLRDPALAKAFADSAELGPGHEP